MATYAAKPLGADKIDRAVETALHLEEVPDVAVLAQLLTA